MARNYNVSRYLQAVYGDSDNSLTPRIQANAVGDQDLQLAAYRTSQSIDSAIEQTEEPIANDKDWFQRAVDSIDSIGHNIAKGFFNYFDGILDFGVDLAQTFGWIGEEDANNARNNDWQSYAERALFLGRNLSDITSGRVFDGSYWGDWSYEATRAINDSITEGSFSNDWGGVGEFVTGLEQNLGYMLPTIITAYLSGGTAAAVQGMSVAEAMQAGGAAAKVVEWASRIGSYTSLGIGAMASKANEKYLEHGDMGRAFGAGVGAAVVEIGSEWLGDKFFGNLLGWENTGIPGTRGLDASSYVTKEMAEGISSGSFRLGNLKEGIKAIKDSGKVTGSSFFIEMGKKMIEEGSEEVFSGIMEPVLDWIGGDEAEEVFSQYLDPNFWFGASQDSVLMQGLSGGVLGMVMDGPHTFSDTVLQGKYYQGLVESGRAYADDMKAIREAERNGQEITEKMKTDIAADACLFGTFLEKYSEDYKAGKVSFKNAANAMLLVGNKSAFDAVTFAENFNARLASVTSDPEEYYKKAKNVKSEWETAFYGAINEFEETGDFFSRKGGLSASNVASGNEETAKKKFTVSLNSHIPEIDTVSAAADKYTNADASAVSLSDPSIEEYNENRNISEIVVDRALKDLISVSRELGQYNAVSKIGDSATRTGVLNELSEAEKAIESGKELTARQYALLTLRSAISAYSIFNEALNLANTDVRFVLNSEETLEEEGSSTKYAAAAQSFIGEDGKVHIEIVLNINDFVKPNTGYYETPIGAFEIAKQSKKRLLREEAVQQSLIFRYVAHEMMHETLQHILVTRPADGSKGPSLMNVYDMLMNNPETRAFAKAKEKIYSRAYFSNTYFTFATKGRTTNFDFVRSMVAFDVINNVFDTMLYNFDPSLKENSISNLSPRNTRTLNEMQNILFSVLVGSNDFINEVNEKYPHTFAAHALGILAGLSEQYRSEQRNGKTPMGSMVEILEKNIDLKPYQLFLSRGKIMEEVINKDNLTKGMSDTQKALFELQEDTFTNFSSHVLNSFLTKGYADYKKSGDWSIKATSLLKDGLNKELTDITNSEDIVSITKDLIADITQRMEAANADGSDVVFGGGRFGNGVNFMAFKNKELAAEYWKDAFLLRGIIDKFQPLIDDCSRGILAFSLGESIDEIGKVAESFGTGFPEFFTAGRRISYIGSLFVDSADTSKRFGLVANINEVTAEYMHSPFTSLDKQDATSYGINVISKVARDAYKNGYYPSVSFRKRTFDYWDDFYAKYPQLGKNPSIKTYVFEVNVNGIDMFLIFNDEIGFPTDEQISDLNEYARTMEEDFKNGRGRRWRVFDALSLKRLYSDPGAVGLEENSLKRFGLSDSSAINQIEVFDAFKDFKTPLSSDDLGYNGLKKYKKDGLYNTIIRKFGENAEASDVYWLIENRLLSDVKNNQSRVSEGREVVSKIGDSSLYRIGDEYETEGLTGRRIVSEAILKDPSSFNVDSFLKGLSEDEIYEISVAFENPEIEIRQFAANLIKKAKRNAKLKSSAQNKNKNGKSKSGTTRKSSGENVANIGGKQHNLAQLVETYGSLDKVITDDTVSAFKQSLSNEERMFVLSHFNSDAELKNYLKEVQKKKAGNYAAPSETVEVDASKSAIDNMANAIKADPDNFDFDTYVKGLSEDEKIDLVNYYANPADVKKLSSRLVKREKINAKKSNANKTAVTEKATAKQESATENNENSAEAVKPTETKNDKQVEKGDIFSQLDSQYEEFQLAGKGSSNGQLTNEQRAELFNIGRNAEEGSDEYKKAFSNLFRFFEKSVTKSASDATPWLTNGKGDPYQDSEMFSDNMSAATDGLQSAITAALSKDSKLRPDTFPGYVKTSIDHAISQARAEVQGLSAKVIRLYKIFSDAAEQMPSGYSYDDLAEYIYEDEELNKNGEFDDLTGDDIEDVFFKYQEAKSKVYLDATTGKESDTSISEVVGGDDETARQHAKQELELSSMVAHAMGEEIEEVYNAYVDEASNSTTPSFASAAEKIGMAETTFRNAYKNFMLNATSVKEGKLTVEDIQRETAEATNYTSFFDDGDKLASYLGELAVALYNDAKIKGGEPDFEAVSNKTGKPKSKLKAIWKQYVSQAEKIFKGKATLASLMEEKKNDTDSSDYAGRRNLEPDSGTGLRDGEVLVHRTNGGVSKTSEGSNPNPSGQGRGDGDASGKGLLLSNDEGKPSKQRGTDVVDGKAEPKQGIDKKGNSNGRVVVLSPKKARLAYAKADTAEERLKAISSKYDIKELLSKDYEPTFRRRRPLGGYFDRYVDNALESKDFVIDAKVMAGIVGEFAPEFESFVKGTHNKQSVYRAHHEFLTVLDTLKIYLWHSNEVIEDGRGITAIDYLHAASLYEYFKQNGAKGNVGVQRLMRAVEQYEKAVGSKENAAAQLKELVDDYISSWERYTTQTIEEGKQLVEEEKARLEAEKNAEEAPAVETATETKPAEATEEAKPAEQPKEETEKPSEKRNPVSDKFGYTTSQNKGVIDGMRPANESALDVKEKAEQSTGKVLNAVSAKRAIEKAIDRIRKLLGTKGEFVYNGKTYKYNRLFEDFNHAPAETQSEVADRFIEDMFENPQQNGGKSVREMLLEKRKNTMSEASAKATITREKNELKKLISDYLMGSATTSMVSQQFEALDETIALLTEDIKSYQELLSLNSSLNTIKNNISKELKDGGTGQIKVGNGNRALVASFIKQFRMRNGVMTITNIRAFANNFGVEGTSKLLEALTKDLDSEMELSSADQTTLAEAKQYILEEAREISEIASEEKHLSHLSYKEVDKVVTMVQNIAFIYRTYSKEALAQAKAEAKGIYDEIALNIDSMKKGKFLDKVRAGLFRYLSPDSFFTFVCGGQDSKAYKSLWKNLVEEPYKRQLAQATKFKKAFDATCKEISKHGLDQIKVSHGDETIKLHRNAIYSFYLNSKSKANDLRLHAKTGVPYTMNGRVIRFTYEEMSEAAKSLTEAEKNELDAMFAFVNNGKEGGLQAYFKDTMEKNLGFYSLRENYWPIASELSQKTTQLTEQDSYGHMGSSALMNDRFNALKNTQNAIEISTDPIALIHGYIDQLTISGEMGVESQKLSRLLRVKNGGMNIMMKVAEAMPEARANITHAFNSAIGNNVKTYQDSFGTRLANKFSVATLGLNFKSMLKQLGSYFTAWQKAGVAAGFRSMLPSSIKSSFSKSKMEWAKANNPVFANRLYDSGYVKGITLSQGIAEFGSGFMAKFGNLTMKMLEVMDTYTCMASLNMAQNHAMKAALTDGKASAYAKEQWSRLTDEQKAKFGNDVDFFAVEATTFDSEANRLMANDMFSQMIMETQSNSDRIAMSRVRSGNVGQLSRIIFGMFGSDSQNKASLFFKTMWNYNSAKKAYNEDGTAAAKSLMDSRKRELGTWAGGIVASGLLAFLVDRLVNWLQGRKEEEDIGEHLWDMASETLISWVPYVNSIADWFTYGGVDYMPIENLDTLISTVTTFAQQGFTKKNMRDLIVNLTQTMGIPAKNASYFIQGMVNIFSGMDMGAVYKYKNLFQGVTESQIYGKASSYISNGDYRSAASLYSVAYGLYKFPISNKTADEFVRLKAKGVSFSAPAKEKYEDAELQQRFDYSYSQITEGLDELVNSSSYAALDDASKARAISRLTSAYKEASKAYAEESAPTSKLSTLAYYGADLAKIVSAMASVQAGAKKTEAVKALNKVSGLTKAQRLLVAWLMGYSVGSDYSSSLVSAMVALGVPRKVAKNLVS